MEMSTIILSKLIPPIPSSSYMRRSSLIKKLKLKSPLFLLHSGAGFGKSSALAQYFYDSSLPHSWYTITEEDDNISLFLCYLVHSIRRVVPLFGECFIHKEILSKDPTEQEITRWYTLFSNELEKIGGPLYIVLDDFHLVDHVYHINHVIEKIVEFLPRHIHLLIASRTRPSWSILFKFKLNNKLVEITQQDLMFFVDEIQVFFEDYFSKQITEAEAKEIWKRTEGWAIAIHLIALQLVETGKQLEQLYDSALKDLFSYLSNEVFLSMSQEDQQSILNFSIFPVFTAPLIEEFFNREEAINLERLAKRYAFIRMNSDGNSYRFHPIFQTFLESTWLQVNRTLYNEIQKKVSINYSKGNNMMLAIYHADKTKDEYFLGNTISQFAARIIQERQFDWLLELLKQLSPKLREELYVLYYYEGECHRYRASYDKAKLSYEQCLIYAEEEQDIEYLSRANAGLAHIYLDTIQPGFAKDYLIDAVHWADQSSQMNNIERVQLKCLLAENLVNLGKANEASQWVIQEKIEAHILSERNLDARIYLRSGKLQQATSILENRLGHELSLVDSHRETEVLLSFIYSLTGDVEAAKRAALRGIEIALREQSGFLEAVGWIRKGHVELLEGTFDLETSESYYLFAVNRMEELNVSRGKAEPYMGLSILKSRQGLIQEAISYAEKGLRETERGNDFWLSAYLLLVLTMVYYESRDMDKALQMGLEANRQLSGCGDVYGEMITHYWLMMIYHYLEQDEPFAKHAQAFAYLCTKQEFVFFIQKKTLFGPMDLQILFPTLQKAILLLPHSREIKILSDILQINTNVKYPGFQLSIQLLGPFTLFQRNMEISDRIWRRDKSKELLAYLYLQKNRFVPKEELMSAIWGDGDEATINRDFKVALNALLKVIEPQRSAREDSYFVIRKQSMYRINPTAHVESDLNYFKRYRDQGMNEVNPLHAKETLLKAEKLYKGALFEDKPMIEWIANDRENIQNEYILLLERLAQTCTRLNDFEGTIYWAKKLIRIDATWEEAYRLLMFAYYQLHNRAYAVKWYNRCVKCLKQELNIEPMQITIQMYEMITSYG